MNNIDYTIRIWHKGEWQKFLGEGKEDLPALERHYKLLLNKIWPRDKFAIFRRDKDVSAKWVLYKELNAEIKREETK